MTVKVKMAIAAETFKHPSRRGDYKVWFLKIDHYGRVAGIGVMNREEIVQDLFNYQQNGLKSPWRVFKKGSEASEPVEIFDFISQNMFENTHFGNLPTLSEFQETLNHLQLNLELKSIA